MNKEITNWTYQKGELAENRFLTMTMIFGCIVCAIATIIFIVYLPSGNGFYLFSKTKIGGWLMVISIIIIWMVVLFICSIFHTILFTVYKKFVTIPSEDISFTNDKIITAKKEWILNDDKRTLTEVKIETKKNKINLLFSGTIKKDNGINGTFNEEILEPEEEIMKAEKIVVAFTFETNKTKT